jgi:hypothetical protein
MLRNDCCVLVGGLSPRLSQYRQAREPNPASVESVDCVSPASVRAAFNCLLEAMFDITVGRSSACGFPRQHHAF